jgi:diaminopimelate dehydrogenase
MKIGIVGYGNLGQGVESALRHTTDMELAAVFTRRNPGAVKIRTAGAPVLLYAEMEKWKGKIDVMILCGGSATDLPIMTPEIAAHFHLVDSFDTHANIPAHFAAVDAAAKRAGTVAVISSGWDPGLFSVNRLYANAILPQGKDYTFWGKGLSQGHSDAIRRIPGVSDARQYTVPVEAALQRVRSGENPSLTTREKHTRECFVVAEPGADRESIAQAIKTMPNYFADYDTTVTFITQEELLREHGHTAHGGYVIRSGRTGWDNETTQTIESRLTLGSNPEFTANVLVATARGAFRLAEQGQCGCKTLFDLPPASLSPLSGEELRAALL